MTKRTNPFDDYSPMQLKMHIGIKEVDLGVKRELRMKLVYERTKAILYENRVSSIDKTDQNKDKLSICHNGRRSDHCAVAKPQTSSKYKQLQLDSFGQLQRNGQCSASSSGQPTSTSCPSCTKPNAETSSKCSFCENYACDGCLRRCFNCNYDFCSICSFMTYDRSEDKSVCLSCSTTRSS